MFVSQENVTILFKSLGQNNNQHQVAMHQMLLEQFMRTHQMERKMGWQHMKVQAGLMF